MSIFNNNNDKQDLIISMIKDLSEKTEVMGTHLHGVDKTLIKQELNLQEHMKRSLSNEENVKILKEQVDKQNELIQKRIELEDRIIFLGKVVIFISGAVFGIFKLIGIFKDIGIF